MSIDVSYDTKMFIKNSVVGGAYLHSHTARYPDTVGAPQKQVTGYNYRNDSNNFFLVRKTEQMPKPDSESQLSNSVDDVQLLRNGDVVRLQHHQTKANLHSHLYRAPVTQYHYQVTGYGTVNIDEFFSIIFTFQVFF